jgi:iron complex transport system substrate-binding protein
MGYPLGGGSQVGCGFYSGNMHKTHGWAVCAVWWLLCAGTPALSAPQHVVSTFLCTDEYVFRLLPRERIAALSFEAGDRNPVVSTIADRVSGIAMIRPSTETVLDLSPDLVVMYAGTKPELHAHLEKIGVPILDVPWANSLADVRKITAMLGERLGARDRAAELIEEMDSKIAAARAGAPRPAVRALIYEPNGYVTGDGVTDEILQLSGLVSAAPGLAQTRLGTLPIETVIASAPELLILSGSVETRNAHANLVQHHPALAALGNRTFTAWAPLTPLLCPGPWSLDAAATFEELGRKARALAPARPRN